MAISKITLPTIYTSLQIFHLVQQNISIHTLNISLIHSQQYIKGSKKYIIPINQSLLVVNIFNYSETLFVIYELST